MIRREDEANEEGTRLQQTEATGQAEQMRQVGAAGPGEPGRGVEPTGEEKVTTGVVAGGSMFEAIGGLGAIVLAILGLVGVLPTYMATVSAICIGGALIFKGGAIAAQFSRVLRESGEGGLQMSELGGGVSAELLGGAGGVILGILGLVGVYPLVLTATAAVIFGGALVLSSATSTRLNALAATAERRHTTVHEAARGAVLSAGGAEVLVGFGAITLGILVLANVGGLTVMWTLNLVALLSVAGAIVLTGTAVGGRMLTALSSAG